MREQSDGLRRNVACRCVRRAVAYSDRAVLYAKMRCNLAVCCACVSGPDIDTSSGDPVFDTWRVVNCRQHVQFNLGDKPGDTGSVNLSTVVVALPVRVAVGKCT